MYEELNSRFGRINLRIPYGWTDDHCYTEGHIKDHQPFQSKVGLTFLLSLVSIYTFFLLRSRILTSLSGRMINKTKGKFGHSKVKDVMNKEILFMYLIIIWNQFPINLLLNYLSNGLDITMEFLQMRFYL